MAYGGNMERNEERILYYNVRSIFAGWGLGLIYSLPSLAGTKTPTASKNDWMIYMKEGTFPQSNSLSHAGKERSLRES